MRWGYCSINGVFIAILQSAYILLVAVSELPITFWMVLQRAKPSVPALGGKCWIPSVQFCMYKTLGFAT